MEPTCNKDDRCDNCHDTIKCMILTGPMKVPAFYSKYRGRSNKQGSCLYMGNRGKHLLLWSSNVMLMHVQGREFFILLKEQNHWFYAIA